MKIKLPVTWSVAGWVEVEADSIDQAVEKFDPAEHNLPENPEYIDGSFELSYGEVELIKMDQD